MVILDPDHGAWGDLLEHDLSETHIGLAISQPVLLVEVHLSRMIVKEGPEDGIRETVIVAISDVIVEVYGLARVLLLQALVDEGPILWRNEETWPSDPCEVERLFEAGEGRYEPARGHFEVVLAMGVLVNGYRQTIGDDDEVAACCRARHGGRWTLGRYGTGYLFILTASNSRDDAGIGKSSFRQKSFPLSLFDPELMLDHRLQLLHKDVLNHCTNVCYI